MIQEREDRERSEAYEAYIRLRRDDPAGDLSGRGLGEDHIRSIAPNSHASTAVETDRRAHEETSVPNLPPEFHSQDLDPSEADETIEASQATRAARILLTFSGGDVERRGANRPEWRRGRGVSLSARIDSSLSS